LYGAGLLSAAEVLDPDLLLQACRRDILDLMPREQRILTELAWQAVSQAWHDTHRTPVFYNYALGKAGLR
jgi:hypothetical protein